MFTRCATRLTRMLISNDVIAESDFELYNFGFEMSLSITANIITSVIIGILLRMPIESMVFLVAFIPLRSYVGGFHASNHFRCYWLSIFAIIATLFLSRFVLIIYNKMAVMLLGIACVSIMLALMPVQDQNRPLDDIEIIVYRRRARIVLCLEISILIICILMDLEKIASVLICVFILTCSTACIGAIKNYSLKSRRT